MCPLDSLLPATPAAPHHRLPGESQAERGLPRGGGEAHQGGQKHHSGWLRGAWQDGQVWRKEAVRVRKWESKSVSNAESTCSGTASARCPKPSWKQIQLQLAVGGMMMLCMFLGLWRTFWLFCSSLMYASCFFFVITLHPFPSCTCVVPAPDVWYHLQPELDQPGQMLRPALHCKSNSCFKMLVMAMRRPLNFCNLPCVVDSVLMKFRTRVVANLKVSHLDWNGPKTPPGWTPNFIISPVPNTPW